jgi:hypothetical protein
VKPHAFDPFSLLLGCAFFVVGAVFAIGGTTVPGSHLGALWPIPLIAVGVVIVFMAGRAALREASGRPPEEQPPPES